MLLNFLNNPLFQKTNNCAVSSNLANVNKTVEKRVNIIIPKQVTAFVPHPDLKTFFDLLEKTSIIELKQNVHCEKNTLIITHFLCGKFPFRPNNSRLKFC